MKKVFDPYHVILIFICLIGVAVEIVRKNCEGIFWSIMATSFAWEWYVARRDWYRTLKMWENDLFKKTCLFTSSIENQKFIEAMRKICKTIVESESNKE